MARGATISQHCSPVFKGSGYKRHVRDRKGGNDWLEELVPFCGQERLQRRKVEASERML